MTREVRLREEADEDLNEAAAWYEAQRSGLGAEFLDSVLAGFRSIAATPLRYALIRGRIRRALIARFPFGIYFIVERSHIVVLAVMHGTRHPRRWQRRR